MRYYPELKNPQLSNLIPHLWKEEKEKILLAEDGLYKYIKETLYKFKIIPLSTINISPFSIQNIQFFPMGFNFQKKEEVIQIPKKHYFMELNKKIYKLNEKSTTVFIIEYNNKKIKDFYFESSEEADNHSLREDLSSFLSLLK